MTASTADAPHARIQRWFARRTPWQRRGLAFAAGAAATLGHAPFQLTLLYVAAVVILVWLLDAASEKPKRLWSGFATGWFFGFGHLATGLYWVSAAFMVDPESWGPIWGVPATLGLAGGLALFFGLGGLFAMLLWTRGWRRIAAFALAFFASEWLRGHLFGGFPWLLPGYVWTAGEPISQTASLIGAYGLSLLTLLIAATPAAIADGEARPGARFAPMLIAALFVGMGWGWGEQRLAVAQVDPPGALPVVRVADSGLSQAEKWEPRVDQEWRVLARYLAASGPADDSHADIVVWPEGAIPVVSFFVLENQLFLDAIGRGMGDRVLITGLTRREATVEGVNHYNSAVVIDGVSGEARVSQIYDKHHLVPFGEYVPLWSLVSGLNIAPLQQIGSGFAAGPPPTRLVIPGAPPAVMLICYEAIFPNFIPRGEGRPGWMVSVTNDAWFGGGSGPYQHYAMARYRTIEEGLPMARAASGGVSAIIDSYGRAVDAASPRTLFAQAQIPPALPETIWVRWGSILIVFLLVFIGGLRFFPANLGRRGEQA